MSDVISQNIGFDVKYIFLSFAQSLFAEDVKYTWKADLQKTKVIIADKNAIDLGITVKRPSIILSRGGYVWSNINLSQRGPSTFFKNDSSYYSQDKFYSAGDTGSFTDLLRGTVTFSVVSKNGLVCEEIANTLFNGLTVYLDKLKSKGIHQITNLALGEEQIVKATADIEASLVGVSLSYSMKKTLNRGRSEYNCQVYVNDDEIFEGIHFRVGDEGTTVIINSVLSSTADLKVTYKDAITMNTRVKVTFAETPNGVITEFTVPNGEAIYGYYKVFSKMIIDPIAPSDVEQEIQVGE